MVLAGEGILLVRLGAVGDVIRTLPCLAALRRSFPEARLAWVVEAASCQLLPGRPWLDETIVFPRKSLNPASLTIRPGASFSGLRSFLTRLRAFAPRYSLDFQGTLKSSLIAGLSGTSRRIGFDRSGSREWSWLLNNVRVRPSSPRLNRVLKNLELTQPFKPNPGPIEFPFPQLEESQRISDFFTSLGSGRPIAIHPGTSLRQAHKRWPEERFALVIQGLSAQGLMPILTWGPGELPMVERILLRSNGKGFLAPPTTLMEMRQLLTRCHLFIGGDTGPMHLAWTHGVPVLALFGSTDPEINGPLGDQHRILAPAWEAGRPRPRRGDPSPLREILPDRVLREALELLQSAANPSSRAPAC